MRYILAIGGNAIGNRDALRPLAKEVRRLRLLGNQIVVTHGNGPQVGKLALHENKSLAELTAQTQAEIGIALEDAMQEGFKGRKSRGCRIATVFTRVLVDAKDPSFEDPSKPIGPFYYTAGKAKGFGKHFTIKKLIGGYRRVVASPKPIRILDLDEIETLLKKGYVVIAGGGGGVAVTRSKGKLRYADAVIDKDRTSSLLGSELHADALLFFTKVDGAYLNFKKKGAKRIGKIDAKHLESYIKEGVFEQGSMEPKVSACVSFLKKGGKKAVIGSLYKPKDLFAQRNVTVVTN